MVHLDDHPEGRMLDHAADEPPGQLDQILAAERSRFDRDRARHGHSYPQVPRVDPRLAIDAAVALESEDADLRRILRYLHRPNHDAEGINWVEGRSFTPCVSCPLEASPCMTRRVVDGDEEALAEVRAELEARTELADQVADDPWQGRDRTGGFR